MLYKIYNSIIYKCARLNLGRSKYSFSWTNGHIIAQTLVESVVISLLLSESANLGLIEECLLILADALKPLCNELSNGDGKGR